MMQRNRIYIFYTVVVIGLMLLVGRLAELQLIFGAKNRALAEGNRIRRIELPSPRGVIYDRQGVELTRNVPLYRTAVRREGVVVGWQAIDREEAMRLESRGEVEELREDVGREYLFGPALAHVLGYLGEVNEEEVSGGGYKIGDLIGRTGIEQQYDSRLRGKPGGKLVEVDAAGKQIRQMGVVEPTVGEELQLTIDAKLSEVAFKALGGKSGAVVVSDTRGNLLALVSSPGFDPNLFRDLGYDKVGQGMVGKILTDESKPMLNRAIGANYPPGSTFKIVSATAGLEEGKLDGKTLYDDQGLIRIGEYVYRNWYFSQYGRTEGKINLVKALQRSTDTFFYKVGEWVGAQQLADWARRFGFGQVTGVDLPGEVAGYILDPQTKEEERGERWFLGNTYHFAIGQGYLLATPLQVNAMTEVVANGGSLCRPEIVQSSKFKVQSGDCQELGLKKETLELIRAGMEGACSAGGTAYPFVDFKPETACKTGTAEFGDLQEKTHAWFTAFAPADKPEIVVTVLVEGGGEGSSVAAPIAKTVMEAWFSY